MPVCFGRGGGKQSFCEEGSIVMEMDGEVVFHQLYELDLHYCTHRWERRSKVEAGDFVVVAGGGEWLLALINGWNEVEKKSIFTPFQMSKLHVSTRKQIKMK